jgi:hypothetical protein
MMLPSKHKEHEKVKDLPPLRLSVLISVLSWEILSTLPDPDISHL